MTEQPGKSVIRRAVPVALLIAGVTVLHYSTPVNRPVFHEVYNRLYYLPIILGAFFFGLRGGVGTSVIVSLIFLPHILLDWGGLVASNINMLTEMFLYNVVGVVTGVLVSAERRYRGRLSETSVRLRASLAELEEKTNMLVQREEELRQSERLSLLGEMSAMMAHEIRNPLGSIRGAAEILSDSFREGDEEYRYAAILTKEVDRLNRVVENFTRVGSIRRGRRVPVDVNALLDDLLFFFGRTATRKGVSIEARPDPGVPPVQADPNQLHQAFMNLILNAVHAMDAGGRLTIDTRTAGDDVEVVFADTGPGIDPEAMPRLFEPFYSTRDEGTGLGLTITKRIVEAHGGRIGIESEPGKGTTVRVVLPAVASSEDPGDRE